DLFMRATVFAALLTAVLLPSSTVWAQSPGTTSSPTPGSPEAAPAQPAETTRQIPVSSIFADYWVSPDGATLGDIEQVVEHSSDKKMYLVVSNGGVMGLFEDQVVVP